MTGRTSILFLIIALLFVTAGAAKDCFVYFGTFTGKSSKGIYVSLLDMATGKLSSPALAVATPSPGYLAVSPDGRFLYAVTGVRSFQGMSGGAVSAFAIDGQSGQLKLLDQKFSGGAGPSYVGMDAAGRAVFVANYTGGSVKSFHVNPDGTLADGTVIRHHGHSVNANRQSAAHAHCMVAAPGDRFVLACDLGLDKVMIYKFDPVNAALTANEPAFTSVIPGSGPRHVAFSVDGKTAYVVNEMACTVTVFNWDGLNGRLDLRQTVGLLPPVVAVTNTFTAAEIAVGPDGRFVYATVRGHDSVSVLAEDSQSGNLSLVENLPCCGDGPRGMGIDPTGHWLIIGNQNSGTVITFGISAKTGRLTPTGQVLSVGAPVDVKFAPAARKAE